MNSKPQKIKLPDDRKWHLTKPDGRTPTQISPPWHSPPSPVSLSSLFFCLSLE
jgi:hypothetical protein